MKKTKLLIPIILVTLMTLFSCDFSEPAKNTEEEKSQYSERIVYAMDTVITIRAANADEPLLDECETLIYSLEKEFSATDPESELSKLNSGGEGTFNVSDDMRVTLETALNISSLTQGAFNPALGKLVSLWDIPNKGEYVPASDEIAAALTDTDINTLSLEGNSLTKSDGELNLALGGIAKGYSCQKVVELLEAGGSGYGIVSFGGNVGVYGSKPDGGKWKIAIKNPRDENASVGYLYIDSGYVAVSGDYERYFELDGKRYHHIFDPSTGYPSESGIMSAAVWSQNGAAADGLSTALFVMGKESALKFYEAGEIGFEAVLTDGSGTFITDGLSESFERVSQ